MKFKTHVTEEQQWFESLSKEERNAILNPVHDDPIVALDGFLAELE